MAQSLGRSILIRWKRFWKRSDPSIALDDRVAKERRHKSLLEYIANQGHSMASDQYRQMYGDACPPKAGDRWCYEDDNQLIGFLKRGLGVYLIGTIMGRSPGAIHSRALKLLDKVSVRIGEGTNDWEFMSAVFCSRDFNQRWETMHDKYKSEKFWMVQGPGVSRVRHETREAAKQEAMRLAAASPGVEFFIMVPVAVAATTGLVVRDIE